MKFPDQPTKLQDLPQFAKEVRNYLRAITPFSSQTVKASVTANGARFDAIQEKRQSFVTGADEPFFPTPGALATVSFEPGVITNAGRNISPTVGGGATMATLPRPELTITTTGTVYLEATVDGAGAATAIDTKNAATTPTDTSTLKHLTLATVTFTSGVVTVTSRPVRESRPLYVCNGTAIWH